MKAELRAVRACLCVGKCSTIANFLTLLNSVYLVRIVLPSVHYIDHRPKKETWHLTKTLLVFMYSDINVWNTLIISLFVSKLFLNGFIIINFFLNSGPGCRYKNRGLLNVKYCNFDKWMFAVVSTTQSDFFRVSVEKNINGCKLFFWIVHVVSLSAWGRWWRVRHNSWKNVAQNCCIVFLEFYLYSFILK